MLIALGSFAESARSTSTGPSPSSVRTRRRRPRAGRPSGAGSSYSWRAHEIGRRWSASRGPRGRSRPRGAWWTRWPTTPSGWRQPRRGGAPAPAACMPPWSPCSRLRLRGRGPRRVKLHTMPYSRRTEIDAKVDVLRLERRIRRKKLDVCYGTVSAARRHGMGWAL